MLLEIVILLEIVAFVFLALGIIPFKGKDTENNLPLLNKILFVLVAAIVFFALSLGSVQYQYNYCYINQTLSDFTANTTTSTATCNSYNITNQGLAYLNMGMGFVSLVLMIIMSLFAIYSRKERFDED